ncbi:MAG: hypothetical protein AABW88_02665 [Nanoarchaeota archaeon]
MVTKIFGVLDFLSAIVFLIPLPKNIVLLAASYLIIKGLLFSLGEDIASYLDVAIGIYIIIFSFGFSITILSVISALFLLQKGLLSFV